MKHFFVLIFLTFSQLILCHENGEFVNETKKNKIPFTLTQYATKHGLPQNHVLSIIQTNSTKLIISTANGITEFNGLNFKEIITEKEHKKIIFSRLFYQENSKKLYGIKFGKDFYQLTPKFEFISDFKDVAKYKNYFYGIKKNGKIFQYLPKNRKLIYFTKIKDIDPHEIDILYPYIYITSSEGIFKVHINTKKITRLYSHFTHRVKINNNKILFLTHRDLLIYDGKNLKSLFHTDIPEISFNDVEQIAQNEYFIASTSGLFHLKSNKSKRYRIDDGLPSEYFQKLHFSIEDQILFIGTAQKGLLKLEFKKAKNINEPPDFILNSLNSIVKFENKIIVSSANGNIFEMKDSLANLYMNLKANISSCSNINDTLAIGTWGEGIILVKNQKKIQNIFKGIKNLNVHAIFKDKKNRIWIGTDSTISIGTNFFNLKHLKNIKGKVVCFYELKSGKICVGTSIGFYIYNTNLKLAVFIGKKNGFYGKEVRSFYEDENGKIWVGTYNGGLFCYENGKLTSINSKKNCLIPEDVFCLAKENEFIYFTGNLGLNAVNINKLNDFYENKIDFLVPFYFGEQAGIYNTEFNGGFQNNYYKDKKHLYFPSIEGITIFQPTTIRELKNKLRIKNIYLNDSLIKSHNIILPPVNNNLKIEFIKINFNSSNILNYQFSLSKNGVWEDWSKIQKENFIVFESLSPGNYELKIRAIDSFMNIMDNEIRIEFKVNYPYYQRWYFFVGIAILLIILSAVIVKWWFNKKQSENDFNLKINNQLLELKLAAIQSKMNPHFVFNVLNNIKYLLVLNKNNEAENLVDDFAILLRKFLSYNDKFFTTINEEIELIKLYISIENIRLSNTLFYEISIEEKIKNKIIPTMLIQPFIENAIKHGFQTNSKRNKIKLNIKSENDFIIIIIDDNGIGFDNAQKNKKSIFNHLSKGIKLVESKIENLKFKYHVFVNLSIKQKNLEKETGTIVTLKILIENEHELRNH